MKNALFLIPTILNILLINIVSKLKKNTFSSILYSHHYELFELYFLFTYINIFYCWQYVCEVTETINVYLSEPGCWDKLGMENGDIADHQLSSTTGIGDCTKEHSRLNFDDASTTCDAFPPSIKKKQTTVLQEYKSDDNNEWNTSVDFTWALVS